MRRGGGAPPEGAPGEDGGGEENEEGDQALEEGGRGFEQEHGSDDAACQADDHEGAEGESFCAGDVAAVGQAGGDLAREEGDGGGDVRSLGVHAEEEKGREGDERAAAGECVLHPGYHGD